MYCIPHKVAAFEVGQVRDGQLLPIDPERVTPELEARLARYRLLYTSVGWLAPIEGSVEALGRAAQGAEAVVIRPSNLVLDLDTARLEARPRELLFPIR